MDKKRKRVRYIYTGKYLGLDFKVYHRFLDAGGKQSLFSRIKNVYIGSTYWGLSDSMPVRPERVDDDKAIECTEKDLDVFNAQDAAAREYLQEKKQAALTRIAILRISRSKRIIAIKREIKEITKNMNGVQLQYFAQSLVRK